MPFIGWFLPVTLMLRGKVIRYNQSMGDGSVSGWYGLLGVLAVVAIVVPILLVLGYMLLNQMLQDKWKF
jgi:hypothetical protein